MLLSPLKALMNRSKNHQSGNSPLLDTGLKKVTVLPVIPIELILELDLHGDIKQKTRLIEDETGLLLIDYPKHKGPRPFGPGQL